MYSLLKAFAYVWPPPRFFAFSHMQPFTSRTYTLLPKHAYGLEPNKKHTLSHTRRAPEAEQLI